MLPPRTPIQTSAALLRTTLGLRSVLLGLVASVLLPPPLLLLPPRAARLLRLVLVTLCPRPRTRRLTLAPGARVRPPPGRAGGRVVTRY